MSAMSGPGKPVGTGDWSIGVAVAWRIAAREAKEQARSEIEPLHVLIGLCSLRKALTGEAERGSGISRETESVLWSEYHKISKVFLGSGINDATVRRAARAEAACAQHTATVPADGQSAPSASTAIILQYASQLARESDSDLVGVTHLLISLLESEGSGIPDFLAGCRIDVGTLTAAARNAISRESVSSKNEQEFQIANTITFDTSALLNVGETSGAARDRVALLLDLPLRLGKEPNLEFLLQMIVERLIAVIPGAVRGALLLCDRVNGNMLLKAHLPPGRPAVSWTLAQRAIDQREAFIWSQEQDLTASVRDLSSISGMYAPLIWRDEVLGVVCVDNPRTHRPFTDGDLQLLFAVARYASLAIANIRLQQELQQNTTLLARLLTNFSPNLRERLLAKARQGKLRVGGDKSEVTVLCADIRGFTRLTENMDPQDILDLLNSYFPALVDAVFRFNGTVDKYVGDAILVVFGSPDPDPMQHENAIRAAIEMQSAMKTLNAERVMRRLTMCEIGIGIHCGEVLHGFTGCADRIEFTVIGDVVNKTARYCDGAKAGEILISPKLHEHTWRLVQADHVSVPTKHEGGLAAYNVRGIKPPR